MTSVSMALPTQMAVMSYSSILGLVLSLFIASAQADITNECRLLDSDGSPVGHQSKYSGSRNETDGWVGEPNTRGSMTIVTTCLVTLGLCVWTSIHVDVQIDQLPFYRLRHKVATSLMALIFPNLVVEEARHQWAEMIRLYEALGNVQYIHKKSLEEKKTGTRGEGSAKASLANPSPVGGARPQSFKTARDSVTPVLESEKDAGEASPRPVPPSEKNIAIIDTAAVPASEKSSALADPKQVPDNIVTMFKRAIGMAERAEDPDYPFSKEVCFFVVMHGLVRPGRNKREIASNNENLTILPQEESPEAKVKDARKRLSGAREKEEGALDKVAIAEKGVIMAKRDVKSTRNSVIDVEETKTATVKTESEKPGLADAEQGVANAKASLAYAKTAVNIANAEVDVAKADVTLAKAEVLVASAEAEAEINKPDTKAKRKANSELKKAKARLTKAKTQLAKPEAELKKVELPKFIITPEEFFNAYARNPDGFRKMIKEKEKDILDKGNASNIAKLIIMAQVTKLVLQMLGRKAMGLSVAVLELHIFVRILIAGLLYCYWWYKQLDVNEPMEIDIGDPQWAPDPMWNHYPKMALRPTGKGVGELFMGIINPWAKKDANKDANKDGFRVKVGHLWEIFLQAFKPSRRFHPNDKEHTESDDGAKDAVIRWNHAVKQINEIRKAVGKIEPAECLEPRPIPDEDVTTTGEEEHPASSPDESPSYPVPPLARPGCKLFTPDVIMKANLRSKRRAMWFYIAYAGLHATVWSAEYFPSWYEKWIWRSACIAVAVVPVIAIGLERLAGLREKRLLKKDPGATQAYDAEEKGVKSSAGQSGDWGGAAKAQEMKLRMVFKWLLELVYLLASLALLAESFSILRAEDIRTYVIKSWTAELPLGR